ncbi:MAG TPA: NAD-dependent epimerase/dehydratase family protein [Candidatus Paceibacterota bacterium]
MAKYIVTGGAGFIGSHIVDALVDRGDSVCIIDDLSGGSRDNVNKKAALYEVDIRNRVAIRKIMSGADGIFHLAALARVQPSILDPWLTNDVNIDGTLAVLLEARDVGVKSFVYSASSSAYGDAVVLPAGEDLLPRPLSPYGLQKYVGEHYTRLFSLLYGMQTVSLRYFNVYGPRAKVDGSYSLVVSKFLAQRSRGEPMTVAGDGTNTRAYTHVRDVVRANLLAMEMKKVGKGEVINIGGNKEYSVLDIVGMIGGPITNIEKRVEPKRTLADTSRAKTLLDWQPTIDFEDGIAEMKRLYSL